MLALTGKAVLLQLMLHPESQLKKKKFAELNDRFFNYNRYNSKMTKINIILLLEIYGLYLQYQHLIPIFPPRFIGSFRLLLNAEGE